MALLSHGSRKGQSFLGAQSLPESPYTRLRRYLSLTVLSVVVSSALGIILVPYISPQDFSILHTFRSPLSEATPTQTHVQNPYRPPMCTPHTPHIPQSIKENIWASLTVEEAVDIRLWLSKPDLGLNLTAGSNAKLKFVPFTMDRPRLISFPAIILSS